MWQKFLLPHPLGIFDVKNQPRYISAKKETDYSKNRGHQFLRVQKSTHKSTKNNSAYTINHSPGNSKVCLNQIWSTAHGWHCYIIQQVSIDTMNCEINALCKLGLRLYHILSWATLPYISERELWSKVSSNSCSGRSQLNNFSLILSFFICNMGIKIPSP